MTKNQLIKKLQKIPGNPIIIVSSDAEGNGFSALSNEILEAMKWDKESREIFDKEDAAEFELTNTLDCIVLWPN